MNTTKGNTSPATVLIVPGLREHVPQHWQTILERNLTNARAVPRMERDKLSCAAWIAALEASVTEIDRPIILVAHSAGAMIVVHWAQRHSGPIQGALLATPADLESPLPPGYPTLQTLQENGWLPIPRAKLPFPSIVAASTNDPLASFERVSAFSKHWGSRFVNVGGVGHLNAASGYGEWPRAEEFIRELAQ